METRSAVVWFPDRYMFPVNTAQTVGKIPVLESVKWHILLVWVLRIGSCRHIELEDVGIIIKQLFGIKRVIN